MTRLAFFLCVFLLLENSALAQNWDSKFPVPKTTPKRSDLKPFEYIDVGRKIPNYKSGKKGEHLSQMQLPLPAEESLKHIVLPDGFRAELVAADPEIRRAICMNWDERGRLWIAESIDYPNELKPPGAGRDRLVICEDTDGDGRADKFKVFADTLSIPSSFTFSRGGVIVFEGRQTVFLKDTDGDDKADERKVLFGGWSMGDTHGGPSNLQYGLDNWLWGMQGYNNSKLTVGGETHQFRQGFFRFKPDASKLEFIRSTNNNTWGLGFSEEGLVFGSTANGNPSVYMPIPNRYYEMVRGWTSSLVLGPSADSFRFVPATDKVRQVDFHGGYTAAAGHALYTARNYPKEYWNRTAFVTEPTGHLVGTFVLRREGTHFRSRNPFNLFASDDEWTAPIMAEVGPDGNVWVVDWYNYIVQHNPTPIGFKTGKGAAYETELRDKKHGRVYRIVYDPDGKGKKPVPFSLEKATPEKLVATLKHDNLFWRKHAQRLLVERGKGDVVPALLELVKDASTDELGLNVGAIHALWTLHGLGALAGKNKETLEVAVAALKHRSFGVRRNAVQVLPTDAKSVEAILASGALEDSEPLVRLAALLALADQPGHAKAGAAVVGVLRDKANADDRWIPDAATSAAARNGEYFLRGLSDAKKSNDKLLAVAAIVAEHYARSAPTESVGGVIASLVDADPALAAQVIKGLAKGWPKGKTAKLNEDIEKDLAKLAAKLNPANRTVLLQLASTWGSKAFDKAAAEIVSSLLARLQDAKVAAEDRLEAARELMEHHPRDKKAIAAILEEITPRTPAELASGLLTALQKAAAPEVGSEVVERMAGFTPQVREAAFRLLLTRPEWSKALLDGAEKGSVRLADLALDQKQILAEHPNAEVRKRAVELLKRGGVLPSADRQKVVEELLPVTKLKGDAAAGKLAFKAHCAKCHVHSGEGTRIGPDLTGMAAHPKAELLTQIMDPSRNVEGNFRIYVIETTAGQFLSGLLASESKTAIELFDAEGKKKTILRENIENITASTKSLMPDGFEKLLKKEELADLLEFLAQRGKYLPLPIDRVATAVSTRGMFYSEEAKGERLVFKDWKPKTVGDVPFVFADPDGERSPNVILMYGPEGKLPPKMPKAVSLNCGIPAKAIHLLSGVSGWGFPYSEKGSVSLIVRLHYEDGKTEDHPLKNGEHFADYIRKVEVPGSKFAFLDQGGRQIRYLAIHPKRDEAIQRIEFVKGADITAPVVMAVTVEGRESE